MKINLNELVEELNKVWVYELAEDGFGNMDLIPEDLLRNVDDTSGMAIYVHDVLDIINKLKEKNNK
jgi:hypothetical protein